MSNTYIWRDDIRCERKQRGSYEATYRAQGCKETRESRKISLEQRNRRQKVEGEMYTDL